MDLIQRELRDYKIHAQARQNLEFVDLSFYSTNLELLNRAC
ncbi:hypothetical protein RintRC_6099 [Richelia intracellularis]|nr:hypothetical protein RintRC_6099 [Richelia intracellularis]